MAAPGQIPAQLQAAAQLQQTVSAAPTAPQPTTVNPTQQQQQPNPQLTAAAAQNPYPGYNLAGIDMSGFNAIDWSSMYGMNMYV
jgi:hypothetical protein